MVLSCEKNTTFQANSSEPKLKTCKTKTKSQRKRQHKNDSTTNSAVQWNCNWKVQNSLTHVDTYGLFRSFICGSVKPLASVTPKSPIPAEQLFNWICIYVYWMANDLNVPMLMGLTTQRAIHAAAASMSLIFSQIDPNKWTRNKIEKKIVFMKRINGTRFFNAVHLTFATISHFPKRFE